MFAIGDMADPAEKPVSAKATFSGNLDAALADMCTHVRLFV